MGTVELGDPEIAAGIAEQDHVVNFEVGGRDVLVVLDAQVAAEGGLVLAVEDFENAEGLAVGGGIPGRAGGFDDEERFEKRVVDGGVRRIGRNQEGNVQSLHKA